MPQPFDPAAWRSAVQDLAKNLKGLDKYGISPRQLELNHLYAVFRCEQYDGRKFDWDGFENVDLLTREVAASTGILPGTYQMVSDESEMPLKFRRPPAPYALVPVIVRRFTDLLFSEARHPQVRVQGDENTEDFVRTLFEIAQTWAKFGLARDYGGSMGTVPVGFHFYKGKPVIEAFDTRWATPTFKNRKVLEVETLEIRFMHPKQIWDEQRKAWDLKPYWYRRVIDEQRDVTYVEVPVDPEGIEPQWQEDPKESFTHGFGFCPVYWIQNQPLVDSDDGEPDCPKSVYEQSEAIDALIGQAWKGSKANSDPTLHVADGQQGMNNEGETQTEISRGRGGAIATSENGKVEFVEFEGTSIKVGLDTAKEIRAHALEAAQCVPEDPVLGDRATATEVDRKMSSMLAKASRMREQYGAAVKAIGFMMLRAIRVLQQARQGANGYNEVRDVYLPPRSVLDPETGKVTKKKRELTIEKIEDIELDLQWPAYFEISAAEFKMLVDAVVELFVAGLCDVQHAVNKIAPFMGVENRADLVKRLEDAKAKKDELLEKQMLAKLNSRPASGATPSAG